MKAHNDYNAKHESHEAKVFWSIIMWWLCQPLKGLMYIYIDTLDSESFQHHNRILMLPLKKEEKKPGLSP